MGAREFHDGAQDGLEALEPLDPEQIGSFDGLLTAMRKTAFGGRRLGEAYEVLWSMIEDPDCFVVLTLSGAMTIAKMGKIISAMIDHGMVQCVVSTGALIAHGLSESVGKTHYRHHPSMSDEELFQKGYNRVYDTLEMESNLNYVEQVVSRTMKRMDQDQSLSSEILTRELGRTLAEEYDGTGILKSAYLKKVPVFIPAFTDSEMGLDLGTWAMSRDLDQARAQENRRAVILRCCARFFVPILRSIPTSISTAMRAMSSRPSGAGSLRSVEGCLAIGRNRSAPTLRSAIRGSASMWSRLDSSTGCASARNRIIWAG